MPYNSVKDARSKIPALKDLSDKQVKTFIAVYDSERKKGVPEGEAIPIAIGSANKINKADNAASTPAKPSERRSGSSKNPKGSAKTGKNVTFSEKVTQALKNKVKEHNKRSKNKVTLAQLKAVYRRGAGAFSTSHRPNMNRAGWAMARVNSFLRGGHSQDNDLKKADQYYLEMEEEIQNKLDVLEKYFFDSVDIEKASASDVKRDSKGNIEYRGAKFAGFNKPVRSNRDGKDGMVLAKIGDQIKLVHFGDSSMRQNYSVEANDRFYDRFGKRTERNDKFSAVYWALRWLWPRGDMKGKGAKPFVPLKKSADMNDIEKNSQMQGLKDFFYGLSCMISPDKENYDKDYLDKEKLWVETVHASREDIRKDELGYIVIKGLDDEKMISYDPLYVNVGKSDAHGDGILDEDLDKLIDNINKKIKEGTLKAKIHHKVETDGFHYLKASRMPMDAYIESGDERIEIKEGQPILKTQYTNKDYWEKKKSGELKNPSIGGKGKRVPNPDYKGD